MISVITPSLNAIKYIERAISSVLKQELENVEHIVVDGGSIDGTVAMLGEYPHLCIISDKDEGQADAMNKGLTMAKGEWVVFLNADDELCEGWLKHARSVLDKDDSIDMLVGNLVINRNNSNELYKPGIRLNDVIDFEKFKFPLNPVSYIYKKSLHERIGQFPVNNHYSMDYWFLLRAYLNSRVIYTDYTTGIFHFNDSNKTANYERAIQSLEQDRKLFLKEFQYHPMVLKTVFSNYLNRSYSRLKQKFAK